MKKITSSLTWLRTFVCGVTASCGLVLVASSSVGLAADAIRISPTGLIGMGVDAPERQLHLRGPNAVFRMDRSTDAAQFLLVRTDAANKPLKTFAVGVTAPGLNNGEFIITDLGSATTGGGKRRMTIRNTGEVQFYGKVKATSFATTSSARYKNQVETLTGARQALAQLRGVRFNWKDTGKPSLGLIAEEVAAVYPEVVDTDALTGEAQGVNYDALVGVLVEAIKEQQAQLTILEDRLSQLQTLEGRLTQLEGLLQPIGSVATVALP